MRAFAQKPKATQQTKSAKSAIPGRARSGQGGVVNSILHLQRTIGNQAVQRLLEAHTVDVEGDSTTTQIARSGHDFSRIPVHAKVPMRTQAKLTVNTPGDVSEQEAERVSEQVMRMPEPSLQRACSCDGGCTNCQTGQLGQGHERVQTKGIGSSDSGLTAAPPIVHEVLGSPGQPLNPATRAFMESRFGHDFSRVRVHTDEVAAQSAEAVAAQAYTVGSDVVFGAGRYSPVSRDGQRLLAHELAHVMQQQSARALQRQQLFGQQSQTIPTGLRSSANIGQMSDQELIGRHDRILAVLDQFTECTPDTAELAKEAARIGVELGRRRALAAGRTFSADSIEKMKDYFIQNAKKPTKPRQNPPPPPPGGWQDSCIVALNNGMKIATDKPALSTTPATIEDTMKKIGASGHSSVAREVWFEGKRGRISKSGALRPEKLHKSIWDTVMSLAGGDPGWSVFTMSLLDGFHSVTLTLDANDPRTPHIYWSDQWHGAKGGWEEYTRSGLDAEVTKRVRKWWDDPDPKTGGHGHDTVVRVWRVSAKAATSSGP